MSDTNLLTKERRSLQTGTVLVVLEIALAILVWAEPSGHSYWYIIICAISIVGIYIVFIRFILSFSYVAREWRPLGIVIIFTIVSVSAIIFLFAILYRWTGIQSDSTKTHCLADCIYFSVITITTVGYGDFHPYNLSGRIVASTEALSGLVLLGVLIASLSNMLRERDVAQRK
jgi:voltage-gated potassium channel